MFDALYPDTDDVIGNRMSSPSITTAEARFWHIASFCCVAVFGRYRGIADYDNPATRQIYGFTA